MKELVEFVATSLVNNKDAVQIDVTERHKSVKIRLRVDPEDTGRVIGRRGQVANAMRTLLKVLGKRKGVQVDLEIV